MRAMVAILVMGVLAACSSDPAASGALGTAAPAATSPVASPGLDATGEPGDSVTGPVLPTGAPVDPGWTPRPAESILVNTAVSVLVDRLNIRSAPAVNAKSLGIVETGDFLLLLDDGPFANDGYTWYDAVFLGKASAPPPPGVDLVQSDGTRGWIAAAKGSTPYVRQLAPRCPSTIDITSVQYMLGAELLACFGSNTIEVSGTFGCSGCGGAVVGTFDPDWLANPINANFVTPYPVGDTLGPFAVRFSPTGPAAPPVGSIVSIRGHFDDAAA